MKEMIQIPTGQRQKTPQVKDNPVLPEGGRAKQAQVKEMITLPEGNKPRQPNLKENIQLPEQSGHEVLTGGILGLADPFSPVSRPLGYLSSVKNLIRADKTGAETRPGRAQVGDKVGSTRILGLAALYTQSGAKKLVTGSGTAWKVYNPTTQVWDSLKTGLTADTKFEGACIDDLLILTNGKDNVQKYDGSSIVDLGGSPPKSPFIAVGYRRVFLVNLPHQLAACDPANPEEWTGEDSATISINAKDGDTITWLRFYGTNLYIWKRHSLHELHGPELGQVSANWRNFKVADVGTPNGRTIAGVGGALFWLSDSPNSKGVVVWAGGGSPQLISDPIQGIIDRINWDYVSTAAAGTDGNGNYLLSVPLDSATAPTHTIVYCTLDGSWWIWEGWAPTAYGSYRLSTDKETYLFGDNTGYVYSIGGDDDAGQAISYEAVVGPAVLGSATQKKRVRRAYIIASAITGASIIAETSPSDIGGYGVKVNITPFSQAITRIKRYLPFNADDGMGGYLYRMKLSGSGRVKFYEVGFEVGVRRV